MLLFSLLGVTDDLNISIQELLLIELLAWFKESFFEWVNSPECDYCFSDTKFSHMSTDPILLAGANRVEVCLPDALQWMQLSSII